MNALSFAVSDTRRTPARPRSVSSIASIIDALTRDSASLTASELGPFDVHEVQYSLPRLLLLGPQDGDAPLRLGLFAGVQGNDPAGAYALLRLAGLLENYQDVARGYCLFLYPVCNPTGFEDNTSHSRRGRELNGEFWRNSAEPEVQLLQAELTARSFHGIISLEGDLHNDGIYAYTSSTTLSAHLVGPALGVAEQVVPRTRREVIHGFKCRNGIIRERHSGGLSGPPRVRPRPFEITLHAPRTAPQFLQEQTYLLALSSILSEYRRFIAYARNL